MIVVDASVLANVVGDDDVAGRIARARVAAAAPYDAACVALAEGLACPLVTADSRLARAPGVRCRVEVLALGDA